VGERERETHRHTLTENKGEERERGQESPYIADRKSCVRAGSSLFGHGGFLAA